MIHHHCRINDDPLPTKLETMRDGWWNTRLLTGTTPTGYPEVK
jgi:hypothetical protein